MKFDTPLLEGKFLKRYKRFFADIELDGKTVTAHVANTGSMKGCNEPGIMCRVTYVDDPKRKLKYTLQMLKAPKSWVGVNTQIPNKIVWEAWEQKSVPHWSKYIGGQAELKINDKSRIDLALWQDPELSEKKKVQTKDIKNHKLHFVEVKNVTLGKDGVALFPDAVTTRGQKHLEELMNLIDEGHTAELILTVQRTDCDTFKPADDIDPDYGVLLRKAHKKGVRISAYQCTLTKKEIRLNTEKPLKVIL